MLLVIADVCAKSYMNGANGNTQVKSLGDKPSGAKSSEDKSPGNKSSGKKFSENRSSKDKSSEDEPECPECTALREVRELREARERRERGTLLEDYCRPCKKEYLREHPFKWP